MGSEIHMKIPYIETPLIKSTTLSEAAGCNVFLKLENLQPSGSFKSRGIGNYMVAKLTSQGGDARKAHFYCSSGGNAGLACVHAAITLGSRATIVVPLSTSPYMMDKLRQAGATDVIQKGLSWQEADDYLTGTLMEEARAKGDVAIYVPPFNAQEVWDGNAGISHEIARQIPTLTKHYPVSIDGVSDDDATARIGNVDAIICSVGGGGLLSGIMQGLDALSMNQTRVIAVETLGADSLYQAVQKRELVTLPAITSLATTLGARTVCKRAFEYGLREQVSPVVVSDADAIAACKRFASEDRFLVELSCAVCPAVVYGGKLKELVPGLNRNSVIVIVICGGANISYEILEQYTASQAST
ncbi:serine family amino acid catabolism-related [Trichoderma arundinaceum]|uniref:L-serine ammonia-lyase n=1 Tax=Trichoderma arundinaceum TaxID=490622 RepID=A0A395NRT9_TRIAR|nr:serine family amino acid catabolism-related [Trichoderma arundinaceum]